MAEPISIQQLKDASEDAITLADFIYKPANVMIPRRLAADINSLQYYLDYMSSYAQHSYETYDEMVANAPNLSENVSVFVTNDLDTSKNGIYTYNGVSFVKGDYQPENVAKDYVESKLEQLPPFEDGVLADSFLVVGGSTNQGVVNKGLESVADLSSVNNPSDKLRLFIKGYHAGEQAGSGYFYYDSTIDKSKHDGGFYIDPTRAYPSDWNNKTQKQAWYATGVGTGKGCFVRDYGSVYKLEYFGAKRGTEASIEINAFFAAIKSRKHDGVNKVEALGRYNTDSELRLTIEHMPNVEFGLYIQATSAIERVVRLSCANSSSTGSIIVRGTGSALGTDRTCDIGISLEACIVSTVPVLDVSFFREWGVLIDSTAPVGFHNNSTAKIPFIRADNCGYVAQGNLVSVGTTGVRSSYSSIKRLTSAESPTGEQASVINVDTLPPTTVLNDDKYINYAIVNGKVYSVAAINRTANEVSLFPLLPKDTPATGNVEYIFGGGVLIRGADSNAINIGNIATVSTPVAIKDMSFYGAYISDIVIHVSTICYAMGASPSGVGAMAAKVENIYTEGRIIDVAYQGAGSLIINGTNGEFWRNLSKCVSLTSHVGANDDIPVSGFGNVSIDMGLGKLGQVYLGTGRNYLANDQLTMRAGGFGGVRVVSLDYATLFFNQLDPSNNLLYGAVADELTFIGTAAGGAMTGTITLQNYGLPNGWTLNGTTDTQVLTPPTDKPCTVIAYWDWNSKDIKVFIK